MVAPRDVRCPCLQIVAPASTRLFESMDYDQHGSSEEHQGEFDGTAPGSSAGVATCTVVEAIEVEETSDVADSNTRDLHGISWSSPTAGVGASDQSSPCPCGAHVCTVSLAEDSPAAFEGLSVQGMTTQRFDKRGNCSSVGFSVGSLSSTNIGRESGQQRGGAVRISHTSDSPFSAGLHLEERVTGEWKPRTDLSRASEVPSPAESAYVDALQPQRSGHVPPVDRSTKAIAQNPAGDPGWRAQTSTKRRGAGAHPMLQPASPGETTRIGGVDARCALVPKAATVAPTASHTAAGSPRLSLTEPSVGRHDDKSSESDGDDQQQDFARPSIDRGRGTSFKPNDGIGGLSPVERHPKAIDFSPVGSGSASSTAYDELPRSPRTRDGSSNLGAGSLLIVDADANVEDTGSDAISSDDEQYNPSVSSQVRRVGQWGQLLIIRLK